MIATAPTAPELLRATPRYESAATEYEVFLKERDILSATLAQRRGHFFGLLGRGMPAGQARLYKARLSDLQKQLDLYDRVAAVLAAGYDPLTLNHKMSVGCMSGFGWRPEPLRRTDGFLEAHTPTRGGSVLEFNAPMPPEVLDAYQKAEASGLFTSYLVASYDKSQFRRIEALPTPPPRPAWYWLEPILIGTLDEPVRRNTESGDMTATHTFMIAQWDLSAEIKLLTASSTSGQ